MWYKPEMKIEQPSLKVSQFADMALPEALLLALKSQQIHKPTPIQMIAIPEALSGKDIIGVAQTGSGKTLAYALATLKRLNEKSEARALILVPTREMAQQIYKVFLSLTKELPVSVCLAIGGSATSKQENQLKKNPKVIIATPGRLNDLLSGNKLLLQKTEVVILDEADRMLDMGFAPQLRQIQDTLRGPRQTLMFSASFAKNVEEIAQVFMKPFVTMIRTEDSGAPVATLSQEVVFLDRDQKKERLLDDLNKNLGGAIVFTFDRATCEDVFKYLEEYGFSVNMIHGELSQGHRNRVMKAFREGELRILVATDLLARGLDVPHVDHVINYDLPQQSEDFLHRIGRTARAGKSGNSLTYITPSDLRRYRSCAKYLEGAVEIKADPTFKFIDRSLKFKKSDAGTGKSGGKPSGKSASKGASGKASGYKGKSTQSAGKFSGAKASQGGGKTFAGKKSAAGKTSGGSSTGKNSFSKKPVKAKR